MNKAKNKRRTKMIMAILHDGTGLWFKKRHLNAKCFADIWGVKIHHYGEVEWLENLE